MRILELATLPQVLEDRFEGEIRLPGSLLKSRQIFRIFRQALTQRFVDKLRHRAIRLCGLDSQRPVKVRIEINGGPFGMRTHDGIIATKRFNVKTSKGPYMNAAFLSEQLQ